MNNLAPEPSIPDLFDAAMHAHTAGELDAARDGYARLRELAPLNADSWHLGGVLEGQVGSMARAEELVRRAIEIDPAQAMFHTNLGNILSRKGSFDDAERAFKRAIELEPQRIDAAANLALMTSWRGDVDEAERQFLAVLETAPGYTPARRTSSACTCARARC